MHERALHALRPAAGPLQAAGTQFHGQIVDVSAGQVLDSDLAERAADGLQNVFVACRRGGSDPVARTQPICARLLHREGGQLHVRACIDLALYLRERGPGLLFGPVPTSQLLTLAVDDARVDSQLVTDDRLAAGAASELDASDLWRQLAALSHLREALRRSFCMRCDEAVNLRRGYPARCRDLHPRQLAGLEEPMD